MASASEGGALAGRGGGAQLHAVNLWARRPARGIEVSAAQCAGGGAAVHERDARSHPVVQLRVERTGGDGVLERAQGLVELRFR
ncbi:MAG TPA: hypothetical protein VKB80_21255 [Kofleriaceae bacterium]|nr:hypothetical protein [Kofleriaceae bacterium]